MKRSKRVQLSKWIGLLAVMGAMFGFGVFLSPMLSTTQSEDLPAAAAVDNQIHIAVVNQDTGVQNGGQYVNYATEIVNTLGSPFTVTSREAAAQGFDRGEYTGIITFSGNFSEQVESVNQSKPTKADLYYQVKNDLSGTTAADTTKEILTLESTINSQLSYLYVSAAMNEFVDVQNKSNGIMENDKADLENIAALQPYDFLTAINLTPTPAMEYSVEPLNLKEEFDENRAVMVHVDTLYKTLLAASKGELEGLVSGADLSIEEEKQQVEAMMQQFADVDPLMPYQAADGQADAQTVYPTVLDWLNQKIAAQFGSIEGLNPSQALDVTPSLATLQSIQTKTEGIASHLPTPSEPTGIPVSDSISAYFTKDNAAWSRLWMEYRLQVTYFNHYTSLMEESWQPTDGQLQKLRQQAAQQTQKDFAPSEFALLQMVGVDGKPVKTFEEYLVCLSGSTSSGGPDPDTDPSAAPHSAGQNPAELFAKRMDAYKDQPALDTTVLAADLTRQINSERETRAAQVNADIQADSQDILTATAALQQQLEVLKEQIGRYDGEVQQYNQSLGQQVGEYSSQLDGEFDTARSAIISEKSKQDAAVSGAFDHAFTPLMDAQSLLHAYDPAAVLEENQGQFDAYNQQFDQQATNIAGAVSDKDQKQMQKAQDLYQTYSADVEQKRKDIEAAQQKENQTTTDAVTTIKQDKAEHSKDNQTNLQNISEKLPALRLGTVSNTNFYDFMVNPLQTTENKSTPAMEKPARQENQPQPAVSDQPFPWILEGAAVVLALAGATIYLSTKKKGKSDTQE